MIRRSLGRRRLGLPALLLLEVVPHPALQLVDASDGHEDVDRQQVVVFLRAGRQQWWLGGQAGRQRQGGAPRRRQGSVEVCSSEWRQCGALGTCRSGRRRGAAWKTPPPAAQQQSHTGLWWRARSTAARLCGHALHAARRLPATALVTHLGPGPDLGPIPRSGSARTWRAPPALMQRCWRGSHPPRSPAAIPIRSRRMVAGPFTPGPPASSRQ